MTVDSIKILQRKVTPKPLQIFSVAKTYQGCHFSSRQVESGLLSSGTLAQLSRKPDCRSVTQKELQCLTYISTRFSSPAPAATAHRHKKKANAKALQTGTICGESSKPDLIQNFIIKVLRISRHSRQKCRKLICLYTNIIFGILATQVPCFVIFFVSTLRQLTGACQQKATH